MGDTCHLILQAIESKLNYHQNEDKAFQSDLSLPVNKSLMDVPPCDLKRIILNSDS